METILMLLVFTAIDLSGLEATTSITIKGFTSIRQCEYHLATVKRQVPDNMTIEMAQCVEGLM